MTQEIEVFVKLTLEVDITLNRADIKQLVLDKLSLTKELDIVELRVTDIREEGEI